jgi:hypothetical protein
MIVQRITTPVKVGCMDKLVAMTKAEIAKWDKPPKYRLYTPVIGKMDNISIEFEFENLAEEDKFWVAWFARSETLEYISKYNQLVEAGEINEMWCLEE